MTDFWHPLLCFSVEAMHYFPEHTHTPFSQTTSLLLGASASYPLGPASLQHLPGALYGAAQTPHRPRPPLDRYLLCLVLVVLLLCISKCLMTPLPPTSFTLLFFYAGGGCVAEGVY